MMKKTKMLSMKRAGYQTLCFALFFALLSQPFFSFSAQPLVAEAKNECPNGGNPLFNEDDKFVKCLGGPTPNSPPIHWTQDCNQNINVSCDVTKDWFNIQKIGDQIKFGHTKQIDEEIKFYQSSLTKPIYQTNNERAIEILKLNTNLSSLSRTDFSNFALPKFNDYANGVIKLNVGKIKDVLLSKSTNPLSVSQNRNVPSKAGITGLNPVSNQTQNSINATQVSENTSTDDSPLPNLNQHSEIYDCFRELREENIKFNKTRINNEFDDLASKTDSQCHGIDKKDFVRLTNKCYKLLTNNSDRLQCSDPAYTAVTLLDQIDDSCRKPQNTILFDGKCYSKPENVGNSCGNDQVLFNTGEKLVGSNRTPFAESPADADVNKKNYECQSFKEITARICASDNEELTNNTKTYIKMRGEPPSRETNLCKEKSSFWGGLVKASSNIGGPVITAVLTGAATTFFNGIFNPQDQQIKDLKQKNELNDLQNAALNAEIQRLQNQNSIQALRNPPPNPSSAPPSTPSNPKPPEPPPVEEPVPFIPPAPSTKPIQPVASPPSKAPATPPTDEQSAENDATPTLSSDPAMSPSGDGSVEDTIMVLLELIDQRKVSALRNSIAGATRARSVAKGQEINGINVGKLAESYGGDGGPAPSLGKEYDVNGDGTVSKEDYSSLEKITRICNKNVTKSPCQVFFRL